MCARNSGKIIIYLISGCVAMIVKREMYCLRLRGDILLGVLGGRKSGVLPHPYQKPHPQQLKKSGDGGGVRGKFFKCYCRIELKVQAKLLRPMSKNVSSMCDDCCVVFYR